MEATLLWCGRLLPIAKSGICTRLRANWIRPAIRPYYSITQSHLECGWWLKDLFSCKIITQSIQVNSARGILKAKRNSTSFNWCGMNLTKKLELNNPQVWLTSGNSWRKPWQNYLPVFDRKNVENLWSSDSSQRGSFWWNKSFKNLLCFFKICI